jgi:hypothetical protein
MNTTAVRIPMAERATPSKLWKTSLFVMASKCSNEAICYLSSDDRFMIPDIESMTRSTLAGVNILPRLTIKITICRAQ